MSISKIDKQIFFFAFYEENSTEFVYKICVPEIDETFKVFFVLYYVLRILLSKDTLNYFKFYVILL